MGYRFIFIILRWPHKSRGLLRLASLFVERHSFVETWVIWSAKVRDYVSCRVCALLWAHRATLSNLAVVIVLADGFFFVKVVEHLDVGVVLATWQLGVLVDWHMFRGHVFDGDMLEWGAIIFFLLFVFFIAAVEVDDTGLAWVALNWNSFDWRW